MWIVQQLKNTCQQIKNTHIKIEVLGLVVFLVSFFFFFKKANKVQPYLKSEVLNKSSVDFVHGFDRRKPTFG